MKTTKTLIFIFSLVISNITAQQTLSWASYTSSSLTYSTTSSCVTMNSSITTFDSPNWVGTPAAPKYANSVAEGVGLKLHVNWNNTASSVTLTIDFTSAGSPIGTTASFSIYNLNASSSISASPFIDSVRVRGTTLANATINPTSISSDSDNQVSNPMIKGHQNGADNPETTTNVTFSSAIKRITITYLSGKQFLGTTTANASNPIAQWITIGSITTNYTGGACAPLPIELTSFNASCLGSKNRLEWTTNSEINNANFSIEKSNDASNFHTIGIVQGAGNSNQPIQYHFDDNEQSGSENYYRLKQTDFDGNYTYSSIVQSNCNNEFSLENNVSLFPNPCESEINLRFNDVPNEPLNIIIYNTKGQIVFFNNSKFNSNTISIATNDLSNGIYYLKVFIDSKPKEAYSSKFIVTR